MRDVNQIIDSFNSENPGYRNRLVAWLNLRFPGEQKLIAELLKLKAEWLLAGKELTHTELVLTGQKMLSGQIAKITEQITKDPRPINKRIWWWFTRPRHILSRHSK